MYLSDLYTVPANLAWLPAISVPMWKVDRDWDSLPIGIQVMWKEWNDWMVLNMAELM
jgi:aspartyl-tRNA(Asn)/glutamyl-tRNA(Gln) amidotransferase subunit A